MTGIGEALDAEWTQIRSHLPHHQAAPAAAPTFTPAARIKPSQQSQPEVPRMSSLGNDFHRIAAILEKIGENGIDILEAAASNPATLDLIVAGARIARLPVTPGLITGAASGLRTLEDTWRAAHQHAADVQAQQQADGSGTQAAAQAQAQTRTPQVV